MRIVLLSLLLLLAAPALALAQIYQYTDEHGTTVYTNQPPDGVEADTVKLPPTNTVDIKIPVLPPPLPDVQEQKQQPYQVLQVTGLPESKALRANNGTFSVGARLEPALEPDHRLRFVLDGTPVAAPGQATNVQLNNIDRGEHSLWLEVLSGDRVIQRSAAQTFTLQRAHLPSPPLRRPARPKPAP